MLAALGFVDAMQRKARPGMPLSECQQRCNRRIPKKRAKVEHVFAGIRHLGGKLLRTIGQARATVGMTMMAACYKMKRLASFLDRGVDAFFKSSGAPATGKSVSLAGEKAPGHGLRINWLAAVVRAPLAYQLMYWGPRPSKRVMSESHLMNPSATIKLFLPFGDPKRVRTAEISNWSGKAVAAPKTDLADLLVRHELQSSGIYFLIGTNPETAELAAYIGEAEIVSERLKQHKSKEFWNSAIVFVSKDENLTKAHIRYLEGRLLERATMVGRYKLTNTQVSGARLPESDQQDMEVFLERIAQLLPVLGSDILTPAVSLDVTQGAVEYLYCSVKDVQAKGLRSPNGFTVLAGSSAVLKETDSAQKHGAWIGHLSQPPPASFSGVSSDSSAPNALGHLHGGWDAAHV
ncbi:hypothetical protein M4R23_25175, partial [Acidovorax sp. GBBC 3332]|nr:hypothetical protein [Acidovorax sp. GBBC 3297]MDA8462457.1 hypothetical protein [Acidovorax sp. GBBC 3333]MDA8467481.1 hypothetical protein [Acidovorax sp. GBBC 3332]MDA8472525.1 hypothetical protein [Acidovorax sp. GBBC 3299]